MIGSDAMIPTKKTPPLANNKGFTLIELIIVMAIFIVAIILSSDAFNRIVMYSKQQMRASESNIQGVVGLELMRTDLEHAGYGLPWVMDFEAAFSESTVAANSLANGIDPADFNDVNSTATAEDPRKVPRAVQSKKSTVDERDYLVVKSTALGNGAAVKKWAYVEGVGGASTIKVWGEADLDFVANDRVVTLDSRTRKLIGTSTANFSDKLSGGAPYTPDTDFQPTQDSDVFVVYGVSGTADLSAPYNRVDYYVQRPAEISTRCAAGTGNLYKGVVNHTGGTTPLPLLECVADLQVVYALNDDESPDGSVDLYVEEVGLENMSAKEIRDKLKEIRVYILAQEGQRDRFYNFPNNSVRVGETIGVPPSELNLGRVFDFAARGVTDWKNYRWKVYTLVAAPRNIN